MEQRLLCLERELPLLRAYRDPTLLGDDRVLRNLLHMEDRYAITFSYFKCVQNDVKEHMRKVVAMWMLEVCEDSLCQDEVFPLAMNYLDRFLSVVEINRSKLQLLGSACLFLASKLKESRPVTAEQLCIYTDNSITLEELHDWELFVLTKLKWDLSAITAHDFLDHILHRLPHTIRSNEKIKEHARTFVLLCSTEFKFSMSSASMIAAASIASAAQGLLLPERRWTAVNELLGRLHDILGIDVDCLRECLEQVEDLVNRMKTNLSPSPSSSSTAASTSSTSASSSSQPVPTSAKTPLDTEQHVVSGTPTDLMDIQF